MRIDLLVLVRCSIGCVCSRLKFFRVVRSVERLFAQMVMWRKAGDPFQSAKKRDQWVRG
jgi:hypothetical protein